MSIILSPYHSTRYYPEYVPAERFSMKPDGHRHSPGFDFSVSVFGHLHVSTEDECRKILSWLETNPVLTEAIAAKELDIANLQARISNLRNAGYDIQSVLYPRSSVGGTRRAHGTVYALQHYVPPAIVADTNADIEAVIERYFNAPMFVGLLLEPSDWLALKKLIRFMQSRVRTIMGRWFVRLADFEHIDDVAVQDLLAKSAREFWNDVETGKLPEPVSGQGLPVWHVGELRAKLNLR